jgi:hypothetical protein
MGESKDQVAKEITMPVTNSVIQAQKSDNLLTKAMKRQGLTRVQCACLAWVIIYPGETKTVCANCGKIHEIKNGRHHKMQ